jgi:hypothetical protein
MKTRRIEKLGTGVVPRRDGEGAGRERTTRASEPAGTATVAR